MRARNYKRQAAKEIDNYKTSSNIISDSFYTTETNDTRYEYGYGRGFNKYDDDDDDYYKYFERYGQRRSIDTFTNVEDFTYSSDDEKYTSNNSPRSKSEKIYSRRYSNSQTRPRRKNQSPREYETQDEGKRRSRSKYRDRNRLESASEQTLGYRSRRSPKTNYQYNIEENLIFKKYFEPTEKRVRERRLEHSKRERRIQDGDEREFKDRKERAEKSHEQNKEYQVYAYENAKPRNNVFMGNTINTGNSGLSSEIELKTHEYPVLAFKERMTTISRNSEMVFVPVFFMDKTNKKNNENASPVKPKPIHQENKYQVYAATLENRNYFEKMVEAFKGSLPGSHKRENSIETQKSPNKYPIFNTESKYIKSILNQTEYNFKQTDSNFSPKSGTLKVQPPLPRETSKFSNETTETKKNPFGNYQQSIVYEVKIDAETAMEKQSNQWSQKSPKQDDLHDDYPVTKDYIKVNGSEERQPSNVAENPESIVKLIRQSIKVNGSKDRKPSKVAEKSESIIKPTRQSTTSGSRNQSVFIDIITDEKISNSISDSKDLARHKSIVKDSFPTRNLSIPEENPPEKILGVGKQSAQKGSLKRSIVEAKSGSLSIPFNSLKEDMSEIRNTQGLTRLSSNTNEPEKQGILRQSTKEHYFENQPNIIRLSRKSTVPQKSSVATLDKQPSIFRARESGTLEKKLSSTKSRFSQVKPQSLSSNPIPETILESRKSAVQPATSIPETQTQPTVPVTITSIELRQSTMETKKTSEDSPSDQRKSLFSPEPKVPGMNPQTIQQNLASQEALREVKNITLDMDYKKEPSQTKASLSKNADFEPTRISEVRQPTLHGEQTEAVLRKLQAFNEMNRDKTLSEEKLTSVVNFSQNLESIPSPARGSLQKAPTYEEKIRSADVRTSIKSSPLVEDFGDVAKLVDQRSEPRRSETKKSKPTVDQLPIKKSDSDSKPKKLVSRIFKKRSQSKSDIKATPSKSLISKRSKQSLAKYEKQTKKAPSKSFMGILKRSRSNISKKSRSSTKEEVPSEKRKEEVPSEQKKEAQQQGTTISKNDTERSTVGSTKPRETKLEEPKPCECAIECVHMIAECGHFFLGTTLHEQIMKILKIMK